MNTPCTPGSTARSGRSSVTTPSGLDPLKREIDAYFDGRLRTFTLAFDLRLATAFARSVLQMITSTPYGTTTTYAAVAERIGRPQALRAVANAVTENPVCLLVPCHRVVEDRDGREHTPVEKPPKNCY